VTLSDDEIAKAGSFTWMDRDNGMFDRLPLKKGIWF
jgi:hypothetical protein